MKSVELHALFLGDVQGVGFRATAREIAKRLNLSGTVQNLPNGSVELFAVGSEEALSTLLNELSARFNIKKPIQYTMHEKPRLYSNFRIIF